MSIMICLHHAVVVYNMIMQCVQDQLQCFQTLSAQGFFHILRAHQASIKTNRGLCQEKHQAEALGEAEVSEMYQQQLFGIFVQRTRRRKKRRGQ